MDEDGFRELDYQIREEFVMPLPSGPAPPLARDGSGHCCRDCQAADVLSGMKSGCDFHMARIAIGNERQEHLRMPLGMSEHFGLVKMGLVRPCSFEDLDRHLDWLDCHGLNQCLAEEGEGSMWL